MPSRLRPDTVDVTLDGVDVTVELRDSAGYRRHSYNMPRAKGGSGEKEVAALEAMLEEVIKAARRQSE